FADMADYVEWKPGQVVIRDSSELPRELTSAVKKVTFQRNQYGPVVALELHDKLKAGEQLARLMGWDAGSVAREGDQFVDARRQTVNVYMQMTEEQLRELAGWEEPA